MFIIFSRAIPPSLAFAPLFGTSLTRLNILEMGYYHILQCALFSVSCVTSKAMHERFGAKFTSEINRSADSSLFSFVALCLDKLEVKYVG